MSGVETILLVEDEAPRRALARRALEARGYRILEASSAEEAVRIAGAHSGAIDLMITDAVMPGGSGPDLARRLAASRPAMRHLFVSGYTDDAIVRNGRLSPGQDFLQKPFTPDTLCQKAREVLDGPPDRAARDRVVSRGR
ncbi:MAG TPA: response regulator [Thermoanaerobaculia bacterium]